MFDTIPFQRKKLCTDKRDHPNIFGFFSFFVDHKTINLKIKFFNTIYYIYKHKNLDNTHQKKRNNFSRI